MSILHSEPLASLLDSLLKKSDAEPADGLSDGEVRRLKQSKTEYLYFYERLKDLPLAVSRETGMLLYMLARSSGAQTVVEYGTSFGISTLFLAAALRDNGSGHLITTEFETSKVARARQNLTAGGLIDLVEIREGDALETLRTDLPKTVDFLLLDGAKALYPEIFGLIESRLGPGALIVADDAESSPDYLSLVRSSKRYMSVFITGDVELSMFVG
jgi:Predicted O-methyltransferase